MQGSGKHFDGKSNQVMCADRKVALYLKKAPRSLWLVVLSGKVRSASWLSVKLAEGTVKEIVLFLKNAILRVVIRSQLLIIFIGSGHL